MPPKITYSISHGAEEKFDSLAVLLLEEAIIAEGRQLDEPAAFVKRLNRLLINSGDADTQDVD